MTAKKTREISDLKAPEVHYCIKSGLGMQYLCDKYGCNESQVADRIKIFYRKSQRSAVKLINRLHDNDGLSKTKKSTDVTDGNLEELLENEPTQDDAENDEMNPEEASPKVTEFEETEHKSMETASMTREELETAIRMQSLRVSDLERKRKSIRSDQRKRNDILRKILTELDALEQAAQEKGAEYDSVLAENRECERRIDEISAKCREERSKLEAMRDEFEVMNRVEIYIYDDETISVSDADLRIDDSGYEDLKDKLLRDPLCRKLMIWEIELLARIIKVIERLDDSRKAELIFENQRVEAAFISIRAASKAAA